MMRSVPDRGFKSVTEFLLYSPRIQFWLLQVIGWTGLCVVTFLSLTLWYNTIQWSYIAHVILQAVLGLLLSLLLHRAYLAIWDRSLLQRSVLSLLAVIVVAAIWTMLRIATFMWLTAEEDIWADYGGWYFASFMILLSWTALFYGIRFYYLLQLEHQKILEAYAVTSEEQLKREHAEVVAREAQLKMLRYQLNPHFLFNALNAIGALVKLEDKNRAHQMLVKLSEFLRYSLESNPNAMISLQQEIDALMMYLSIEKMRFGERLTLDFDISERAAPASVPSLLLQPLAENSVKYAIAPSEQGGTICLRADVVGEELVIELSDTGSGQAATPKRGSAGRPIGLRNTLDRLKALYRDAYDFSIEMLKPSGLKITIRVPYKTA